jgi:probable F420-dependent oxidoreductase
MGSPSEWRELARRVEALGYSSLLVGDHFVDFHPPPMVALAWAAALTETLRLGTVVLGNDYRHPAVLAKEAAALDLLSEGRLELGLGAGWLQADYEAMGLPYDAPKLRVERLAEALLVIKSAWSGAAFDFSGEHYTIRGYAAQPLPAQRPHPPLLVGGGRPRVLRLAGQHADIVSIHPATSTSDFVTDTQDAPTRRKIGWVREGAGARFEQIELMMMCEVVITEDVHATATPIASSTGTSVEQTLASAQLLVGSVEGVCKTLRQRRDDWGVSYVVVKAEVCEDFAPVVARLAGS